MSFDLTKEEPIPVTEAVKLIPSGHRNKKHLSVREMMRWILDGYRGVKLEARKLGASWVTSKEAIARFSDAITAQERDGAKAAPVPAPRYRRGHQQAKAHLAKTGIARRALSRK